MKKFGKILSINLIGAIILAILFSVPMFNSLSFGTIIMELGIVALSIGSLEIIIGIVLLFTQKKDYGQSILLSGVILLVIGFSSCFGAISTLNLNNMH